MLSSGEVTRVVEALTKNRELYVEKHREDKVLNETYNKKLSPSKIVLGSSCNHGQSMRNLKEEFNSASSKEKERKETSNRADMKIIKFNEPSAVPPMADVMGPAAPISVASAAPIGGATTTNTLSPRPLPTAFTTTMPTKINSTQPAVTPSRIGLRRSTTEAPPSPTPQPRATTTTPTKIPTVTTSSTAAKLSPAPTRTSLPNLPSSSPRSPSSPFAKEKVIYASPTHSLLEIREPVPVRKSKVIVYIFDEPKVTGPPSLKLQVDVPEDAKVPEVIAETRKAYQKEKGDELGVEPSDFKLYVAEADGRPDEDDSPPLAFDQSIRKLGKSFCLVPKRSGGTRSRVTTSREKTTFVKIQLPGNEYKTVAFQPDLKIKDLLFQVCHRWNLDATEHAFRVGTTGTADVPPDITMKDLDTHTNGKNNLVLVKREIKPEVEAPQPEGGPVWDRVTAITLRHFEVVKLKGFINRQERTLGISGEMITNESPSGKKTKRPMRLITEVKSIEMNRRKENQFVIRFTDGTTYTYETKLPETAREIVQKVSTCMMLKNGLNST